jgi:ABC-type multidrug transport system fused ATPase/permease subunit
LETENKKRKMISMSALKESMRIFKYLRPYRFVFSIGLVLLFLSSLMTLVIMRLLGQLAGNGIDQKQEAAQPGVLKSLNIDIEWGSIEGVLSVLIVLLLLQGTISFFRVYIFAQVTEKMMLTLRKETYQHLISMPMQFFNESRVGDLNSRISSDITAIQETLTTTLAELIRQTIIIVFGIAALVYFSPQLTMVMLASVPVIMIVAVVFGRYIKKLGKETQNKVAESNVIVQETLSGISNVKSFVNEFYELTRFGNSAAQIRKFAMKGAIWRGFFSMFIIVFVFGAIITVIWQAAKLMQQGELDSDLFFTFLLITGLVGGSIGGLASQLGSLQKGIGSIENVLDIIEREGEAVTLDRSPEVKRKLAGKIKFDKVQFHYASRKDVEVLKNVSFSIESGEQIALVGPSGSGKSTLASLLLRFYEPIEGTIYYDGQPANEYELAELRSQIAIVPQEVILFAGSIRENIAYGKPEASEQEIEKAAKQANALGFINDFPEGMETVVGDRGIQLSGGQRQRIAIARAVLKDPAILILDEATSSLDSESERLVQEALDRLMEDRTSVVIAHRLSTVKNATRILVLNKGVLEEEGTHDELIANEEGLYKRLSDLQFQNT